ncbi:Aquaporin SIP2-1 [Ananas comosus]|uniref:Aquaporin SIP2-1 n=1 Tax=Ananas comosus TaxID=4615 RepID=A0A199V838_ANACO|nr:Aquaporin SIP2-1 [Ananas comosus]
MGRAGRLLLLVASDAAMALAWVWAGALVKLLVYGALGPAHAQGAGADALKVGLSLLYMFVFAGLEKLTGGASYNPLTVLVLGSIVGVKLIRQVFPKVGYGARLNAGIHHGVLAEGLATFVVVMVSLMLTKKEMKSFFMKTWISSISKMTLHILSSDLTGGIMNPASVRAFPYFVPNALGWAYARGDHITLEHLFVYWLAPIQATLLGIWVVNLLNKPKKSKDNGTEESKTKSEKRIATVS